MKTRLLLIGCMVSAALLISQPAPREHVGPMPDGGFLLSSGWRIKAAGTQIPVDTFPMATAVTPDKKLLLVLNGGYNPPSISVIDIAGAKGVSRAPVPDGWLVIPHAGAGGITAADVTRLIQQGIAQAQQTRAATLPALRGKNKQSHTRQRNPHSRNFLSRDLLLLHRRRDQQYQDRAHPNQQRRMRHAGQAQASDKCNLISGVEECQRPQQRQIFPHRILCRCAWLL